MILLHTDDTTELPDDVDELNEIMELGRRLDDLASGNVPIKELRNFVAVKNKNKQKIYQMNPNCWSQI